MERRAASHTEEEEMNQRRRLLNAAKKGDQKAVAKLFELYQVRVYNNEMVTKLNRTAGTHKLQAEVAQAKAAAKGGSSRKSSSSMYSSRENGTLRVPMAGSSGLLIASSSSTCPSG